MTPSGTASEGCHFEENSRVMGEVVPKPVTPVSSLPTVILSSLSSLNLDIRRKDQHQELGSRIIWAPLHCFSANYMRLKLAFLFISNFVIFCQMSGSTNKPTRQALECFKRTVFEAVLSSRSGLFLHVCPIMYLYSHLYLYLKQYYQAGWDCFYTYAQFRAVLSVRPPDWSSPLCKQARTSTFCSPHHKPFIQRSVAPTKSIFQYLFKAQLKFNIESAGKYKITQRQEDCRFSLKPFSNLNWCKYWFYQKAEK